MARLSTPGPSVESTLSNRFEVSPKATFKDTADVICSLMPTSSQGAALVGYTGDAEFNRYLRGKAIKLGMRLNDFGLWKRPEGWESSEISEGKEDDENWELIPTTTEQDVFDTVGEGWIEPDKRNFNNLQGRRRRKPES